MPPPCPAKRPACSSNSTSKATTARIPSRAFRREEPTRGPCTASTTARPPPLRRAISACSCCRRILVFQGFDAQDTALTNATDTLTITNLGPGVPLPVLINEWMADNAGPDGFADPLDGLFKDWFELYNPNPDPVNLSGFYLTDDLALPTQWRIPTNSLIPGRGFLLVWADNKTNLNGLSTNGDLHAAFKLNKDGEAIGLFAPDGVAAQSAVTFGPQMQNVMQE